MKRLISAFLCLLLVFAGGFDFASAFCYGYLCNNGECTGSSSDRCDGIRDCSDGSDELYCPSATCWGYRCDSGECTALTSDRCDGSRDCSDGSDEQNCQTCRYGYLCKNGECTLSRYDRCNDINDCSDGSDEKNCTTNSLLGSNSGSGLTIGLSIGGVTLLLTVLFVPLCIVMAVVSRRRSNWRYRRVHIAAVTVATIVTEPEPAAAESSNI